MSTPIMPDVVKAQLAFDAISREVYYGFNLRLLLAERPDLADQLLLTATLAYDQRMAAEQRLNGGKP